MDITLLGTANWREQRKSFGIKQPDRRQHVYIIGKTGMGKTTLLENMIIQDIEQGRGVGVLDPHGDLAERLLAFIPQYRINDVVHFNPHDMATAGSRLYFWRFDARSTCFAIPLTIALSS